MSQNKPIQTYLKKGTVWSIIDRIAVISMQFLAMLVLARVITPDDFALVGIAMFFIVISQVLLDSGIGGSLLKKKIIKRVDYSTMFIFNMVIGVIMYLLLLIIAPFIARYYGIEELSLVIRIIGLSIIISAFGKIQNVLLYHQLKFREISIISIISNTIALIVAIILAINGYGVWALVVQNLISSTLVVGLQFFYNKYFPGFSFSLESFKEQWNFGGFLLYSQLLNTIYQNLFSMIFPKVSTLNFSGLYSQANKIQQIPSNTIGPVINGVAFPVLAKIDDLEEFKKVNRSFSRKIYIVSFTIFIAISIFSEQIISILLGNQWISAAPILSMLSIGGIGTIVYSIVRNTFKSMGITDKIFHLEIYRSLIGLLFFLGTFQFGNYWIIIGIVTSSIIFSLISMYNLALLSNYSLKEQLFDVLTSILPIIPAILISIFLLLFIEINNVLILVCGPLYFSIVILCGFLLKNEDLIELIRPILLKLEKRILNNKR